MPALPSCLIEPIWEQFAALLPERHDRHPLGCHRPRISDRMAFESTSWSLAPATGAMATVTARQPRCDDAAMSGSRLGSWAGWKPPPVRATTG